MFEFSIAFKYLIPRNKQLSVSLIALMSIGVISLVVWLVLVFLSVTEGIERSWLEKLTKLNAPLKITPTPAYYASYYYKIDALSASSNYTCKTIKEKAQAPRSDPYSIEEDGQIPSHFPKVEQDFIDPVKTAYAILYSFQNQHDGFVFQDYELSGGLMRLQMLRTTAETHPGQRGESQNFLTQVSYVSSFPNRSPHVASLILPPRIEDLNHLLFLSTHHLDNSRQDAPALLSSLQQEPPSPLRLHSVLQHAQIQKVSTKGPSWKIPFSLLPVNASFQARGYFHKGHLTHVLIPTTPQKNPIISETSQDGLLQIDDSQGTFTTQTDRVSISSVTPIYIEGVLSFHAETTIESINQAHTLQEIPVWVQGALQGKLLKGMIPWEGIEITQAKMQTHFKQSPPNTLPWITYTETEAILPVTSNKETGVLLAKSFRDNGILIGDPGYISYTSATAGSIQEMRLPIFVAGFYDPGVMSIGNKLILVPDSLAHTINLSSSSFALDPTQSNGISVWFSNIHAAEHMKQELTHAFTQAGISHYWNISTFREYDFAKDLLEQFQSDKYLFTLVGIIILIVACCNIISLLVLLVNDKKKEIGILQAMGASSQSIALIFGSCGIAMGLISSCIGTLAALFTLNHIDSIAYLLSKIQGHEAFNTTFYGNSLPNQLTSHAVAFVLIATPIISLCAGLVPAIKACRLRPSVILRSE